MKLCDDANMCNTPLMKMVETLSQRNCFVMIDTLAEGIDSFSGFQKFLVLSPKTDSERTLPWYSGHMFLYLARCITLQNSPILMERNFEHRTTKFILREFKN